MSREMKHSGIEWIGEIPNTWGTVSLWRPCDEIAQVLKVEIGELVRTDEVAEGWPFSWLYEIGENGYRQEKRKNNMVDDAEIRQSQLANLIEL